jgi:arsenate reductase
MAHGYLKNMLFAKAKVYSAGVKKHGLNLDAVKVMELDGIDISNHTSNLIEDYLNIHFNYIITVCDHANESCPIFSNTESVKLHKNFVDPSKIEFENDEKKVQKFINVRNQIKTYCLDFANKFFPDR